MKLISLELHNFRKFSRAEIVFPEGITAIIGNNGAGKSTIIEAIGWVIYGSRASRTSQEDIKRNGADNADDCWVRLRFSIGEDEYEVLRIIRGSSTDAQVKVNGMVAATTSSSVTKFLEEKIGMDFDAFYTSIVARQKELNALSDKRPAERRRSMLKMLKIDALEDVIKMVRDDRRKKEEMLKFIESNIKDIDELMEEMKREEERKERIRGEMEEIKKMLNEKEKEFEKAKIKLEEEKKKAGEYSKLDAEKKAKNARLMEKKRQVERKIEDINRLKKKLSLYSVLKNEVKEYDMIKRRLSELEEIKDRYMERKNVEERIKLNEKEILLLNKEIEEYRKKGAELEKLMQEKAHVESKKEKIKGEIEEIKNTISEMMAERKQMVRNIEEIKIKMDDISSLGPDSNCPMCGRKLGEHYEKLMNDFKKQIGDFNEKIKIIDDKIRKSRESVNEREVILKTLDKKMKELDTAIRELIVISGKMQGMEKELKKRETEIDKLKRKIIEIGEISFDEEEYLKLKDKVKQLEEKRVTFLKLEKELERIPEIEEEIEEIKKDIRDIEEELTKISSFMEKIDFKEEEYKEAEKRYEQLREEMENLKRRMLKNRTDEEYIIKEISRINAEIEETEKNLKKMNEIREEITLLSMLAGDRDSGLLNNFKKYLIAKIGPALSTYASHFFSVFTNGKYNSIEIDDDYNIFIYDGGEKYPIDRFSGGEEDLANLSLRLAISELISRRADMNFEFIALDEIFGSQDYGRRMNVLNALNDLKKQFSQIFLITHIEEIKDSVEHIIKIYEDDEGISHVAID
ncbi:MAG: SMC family ATPase [Thermoplasmata archaeon]|nr:SMC family ATPase [Thermoplasmata archaeon]